MENWCALRQATVKLKKILFFVILHCINAVKIVFLIKIASTNIMIRSTVIQYQQTKMYVQCVKIRRWNIITSLIRLVLQNAISLLLLKIKKIHRYVLSHVKTMSTITRMESAIMNAWNLFQVKEQMDTSIAFFHVKKVNFIL